MDKASKASAARIFAVQVGRSVRMRNAFTHDIITAQLEKTKLTPEDKAFATKLALGVTSSLGTLDEIIDRCLRSPKDISPEVRDALRISTYEIIFLEKSLHAAVDQGVELVRFVAPEAAGLANAVLRKVARAKEEFPFGDPALSTGALARQQAFPLWMAQLLVEDLGREAAAEAMEASNGVAPLYVAINALRADEAAVRKIFAAVGEAAAPVEIAGVVLPLCLRIENHRVIGDARVRELFAQGKIIVSDVAAQAIAQLALPQKRPARFLEIGSGRGTKSILLQNGAKAAYGAQMALETLDNRDFKTQLLERRAKQCGVDLSAAHTGDATKLFASFGPDAFDAIFIDAPCSGLGTLRRHPEIRWRVTQQDITELAQLGACMLDEAAACLAVGGQLTYATCTLTRQENTQVIERFLKSKRGESFRLLPVGDAPAFATRLAPGAPDAHFAACMLRVR
ncbi:MAG: transcription antitermination factor NusB [Raoultibacter sp.]